jgi:hypothetical protein
MLYLERGQRTTFRAIGGEQCAHSWERIVRKAQTRICHSDGNVCNSPRVHRVAKVDQPGQAMSVRIDNYVGVVAVS